MVTDNLPLHLCRNWLRSHWSARNTWWWSFSFNKSSPSMLNLCHQVNPKRFHVIPGSSGHMGLRLGKTNKMIVYRACGRWENFWQNKYTSVHVMVLQYQGFIQRGGLEFPPKPQFPPASGLALDCEGSSSTCSRDSFLFWVHSALRQKLSRRFTFVSFGRDTKASVPGTP